MSQLDIAIHSTGDPLPIWPGLGQPAPGTITHCAVLQRGTANAGPSVAFNIEMQRGNVFAELSFQDVQLIWFSLKGALEQWEPLVKSFTSPPEPVQVDTPIPEIPPQPPQPPIPHEPENRPPPAARRPRQQPKRPQPQTPIPPDAPPEAA